MANFVLWNLQDCFILLPISSRNCSYYKTSWFICSHSPLTKTASDPEGMPLLLVFLIRRFPVQVCLPIFQLFVYFIDSKKCRMSTLCKVSPTDMICEQLPGREPAPGTSTGLTSQDQCLHSGSWCLLSEAKPDTTDITTMWIRSFSCGSEKIPGTGDSRNQGDF